MKARTGQAIAAAALVFCASYAAQRLLAAWAGEVPARAVVATAHIPYFWRVGVAALHAGVVGLVVALSPPGSSRWRPGPILAAWVVGLAALAMVWVP